MIQRKQTMFLVLAAVALGAEFVLSDVWTGITAESLAWFTPVTTALFGVGVIGSIATIFLYSDRSRQRRFVLILQAITVIGVVVLFTGQYLAGGLPVVGNGVRDASQWLALCLPLVAYVLFYMARRGIEKDMELVRSMDRLR